MKNTGAKCKGVQKLKGPKIRGPKIKQTKIKGSVIGCNCNLNFRIYSHVNECE